MERSPDISVGIVGIGLMGRGIARNIAKHGHALVVLEHSGNQPMEDLLQAGAIAEIQASALAAKSDLVILCVSGSPEVEAVLTGPNGVLEGVRRGTIVVDCSTTIPSSTERMASLVHAAGGLFLDAPMTRTSQHAEEGRLNLLVGGDAEVLDRAMPVLRCFAENIVHVGPVGAGHRLKLLHNFMSLGSAALLSEAAACAASSGIQRELFVDVLATGGGAGVTLDRLKPYILSGSSAGLQFSMGNALKDLNYYVQMATDAGAVCRIGDAVAQTLGAAVQTGGHRADVPELVSLLADAGRQPRKHRHRSG
ncbi:NAD(P)-dependent oxidoreductase [Variovorax sp. WS11]|uniref:NAD(P)-dependent oxidoreductase n=1 Tax=Variovorax sp. WS11 TaxID=1105204 RepID=UPI000D0DB403|nr:NAD(P)-dependent oxidoreductase [Variovorax sp. WS11]NDZ17073.1 NAD(P)-dependent oxidoreductase [Variovorax sp. WS11]PSL80429.1 NAD(P)-dependent oxidoreductase [Variovorax sp. WS11]